MVWPNSFFFKLGASQGLYMYKTKAPNKNRSCGLTSPVSNSHVRWLFVSQKNTQLSKQNKYLLNGFCGTVDLTEFFGFGVSSWTEDERGHKKDDDDRDLSVLIAKMEETSQVLN